MAEGSSEEALSEHLSPPSSSPPPVQTGATATPKAGPRKGILKPLPPPTQTQRFNASLQSSLSNFKRDFFSGFGAGDTSNTSTANRSPQPGQNVTLLNTTNNAGSSIWKTMSTRLTTLDPVQAASSLPSMLQGHAAVPNLSVRGLRGVRFRMDCLTVTYPLLDHLAPQEEAATRTRVNEAHISFLQSLPNTWTNNQQLVGFYDECCCSREEMGLPRIRSALLGLDSPLKEMDLTGLQLNVGAAEALSDVLSLDFGLKKLILDSCGLDDESIKAILHALLVSATLPTLSIANNRRIRSKGWQYVAIFVRRARALRFLDVSENSIDKRTAEFLVQAITKQPLPSNSSFIDTCSPSDLSTLANILHPSAPLLHDLPPNATPDKSHLTSLRMENASLKPQTIEVLAHAIRHPDAKLRHVSLRRNKISPLGAVALAVMMRDYPETEDHPMPSTSIVTAKAQSEGNSINSPTLSSMIGRARPVLDSPITTSPTRTHSPTPLPRPVSPSVQERFGCLLTLDVRSNEIRHGVTYVAQVLKRNRTLKVLNVCDNKIDCAGLVALADALKYNNTLETLDLSKNPCCGPRVEGITALRTAFSNNTSLLRVFLAGTDLSSEGAIGLAEFLPDIKTLIHLDLTENFDIDIAGVMALAVSVKMNKTIRCLDLNIPPNDPDFARLSQDILQSCVRNTEMAQEESTARGIKQPVSAPIHKSAVARNLEEQQSQKEARTAQTRNAISSLLSAAGQSGGLLRELLVQSRSNPSPSSDQIEILRDVLGQTRAVQMQLADAISGSKTAPQDAIELNQELIVICNQVGDVLDQPAPSAHSLSPQQDEPLQTSPTFSITDSDDESDEETSSGRKLALSVNHQRRSSGDSDSVKSPVESQSKHWVEEEGEVFRKKAFLDQDDDQEEDPEMSGEQLRKEILETNVPRPPPRDEGDESSLHSLSASQTASSIKT